MSVREAIMLIRDAPTIPLDVAVKKSQSNGGMERAIKTIQGQYRTNMCQLVENTRRVCEKHLGFVAVAFTLGVRFFEQIQS